MSFGGQSNAPWQRNVMQNHPQSGAFHQGSAQMFMQTQGNMAAAFNHGGGSGSMFSSGGGTASVSYPQPRSGLNPVAFQQGGSGGGGGQAQHYNSIGTVTKINNECGLVNDEVFFYRNACKGPEPKLGDRVIFEATYATSGQFKWNATRIQLMQHQPQPLMGSSKGYGSSADFSRGHGMRHSSPKRAVSPIRSRHERERRDRERRERSRDRSEEGRDRKRLREDPDRSRERVGRPGAPVARSDRDRHVERDREDKEKRDRIREKEPLGGSKRGRNRPIRRYMVQIPKYQLAYKTSDIQELRQRYSTLYIPSDFFHANIKWTQNFPPENPFSLRRPCRFHIMHKLVEPPFEQKPELLEPADANYLYSAKVMLMSLPPIAELYQKCFEHEEDNVDHHGVHPSRLISFLVGVRGRNEPMAIGGPWSPSLDGENPDKDPAVLIRTAIRTCKALTGIDLSNCTQWYRFVELYYHRTEYKNMEKDGPPRVETVVIFLPDVHACMPTAEDWPNLIETYKATAEDIIARRTAAANKAIAAAAAASADADEEEEDEEKAAAVKATENSDEADVEINEVGDNDDDDDNGDGDGDNDDANNDAVIAIADDPETNGDADDDDDDHSAAADDSNITTTTTAGDGAVDMDDNIATVDADENEEPPPEPTHYTLLDLKSMKVQEIRDELLARNLSDKGVRNVVMARLAKALNNEKAQELQSKKQNKTPAKPVTVAKTTKEVKVKLEKCDNKVKKIEPKDEPMDVDISVNSSSTLKKKTTTPKEQVNIKVNAANNKQKKDKGKTEVMKEKKEKVSKENIEEQEKPWTEADFEMNEMLILDEYDATKNPEDNTPKEMSEKEKNQLIRRYTLPEQPQIIVHPNKMAKNGKFDCAVMSLSVLLDYHPEDTKERFFEVSLFAELFNEMMMRDFGFNIYKEIYLYKEPTITEDPAKTVDEEKLDNENTNETNKDDKSGKKDDNKIISTVVENNKEDKNAISAREHTDDTQSIKSESRKRKLSVSASINDKEPLDKDKKMVVHKPLLLLSFIYFDETQCGYIFEKDLEDLFAILGLNLSRSQIKKMLSKLPTRQGIYYRKLTDKEESLDCTPYIEDDDNLPFEELKRIAAGNWFYEDVFGDQTYAYDEDNPDEAADEHEQDKDDGLINYHGAVVHVGKLMEQIKRTERVHSDLEKIHNDLLKQHAELQKDHNKSNSKIKDLNSEVKSLSRKLNDTTTDLNAINRKYRDQNNTLQYIYNRVSPYFIREKDKEKEKEKDKDHKAENIKDTDKDKEKEKKVEEKDKDKEKEKSKEKDKNKENDMEKETKDKNKEDKEKSVKEENKEKENTFINTTTKTTVTNPTKTLDKAKKSISETKGGETKTSDKDVKKTNEANAKK